MEATDVLAFNIGFENICWWFNICEALLLVRIEGKTSGGTVPGEVKWVTNSNNNNRYSITMEHI